MNRILGIDFGTDNITASFVDENGSCRIVRSSDGTEALSNAFYYDSVDKTVVVGDAAIQEGLFQPLNVIRNVKSHIADEDFIFHAGRKDFSSKEIITALLSDCIRSAEELYDIDGVVISVPSHFTDRERQVISDTAKRIRLSSDFYPFVFIISDCDAVAVAYCKTQENVDKNVLIYDLGGTFDATLLNVSVSSDRKQAKILAQDHSDHIGAGMWDLALRNYVIGRFSELTGVSDYELCEDVEFRLWLDENITRAKIMLTKKKSAVLTCSYKDMKRRIEIPRETFERITEQNLTNTVSHVKDMLSQNGYGADSFDEIILAGRGSMMPQVKERLTAEFGKPVISENPGTLVSFGAAIWGSDKMLCIKSKKDDSHIKYSLGVLTKKNGEEILSNVFLKNTEWTEKAVKTFYTSADDQRAIILRIFRNDSMDAETVADLNDEVYKPVFIGLTPGMPAGSRIDVEFTFSQNKELELRVREEATGNDSLILPQKKKKDFASELLELVLTMYPGNESAEMLKKKNNSKYVGIDIGNSGCRVSYINARGSLASVELDEEEINLRYAVRTDDTRKTKCVFGEDIYLDSGFPFDLITEKPKHKLMPKNEPLSDSEKTRIRTVLTEIMTRALIKTDTYLDGACIKGAVIACPPYYGTEMRRLLKEAVSDVVLPEDRGVNIVGFVDEVTAGLLSYLRSEMIEEKRRVLAVDFGYSLNASVVDIAPTDSGISVDPVASVGLPEYGGDIFNELLKEYVSNAYVERAGGSLDDIWEDAFDRFGLEQQIERAKRKLSRMSVVRVPVRYDGRTVTVDIRRDDFEKDCEEICLDIGKALDAELKNSRIDLSTIDEIVLMGGAASMPILEVFFNEFFDIPVTTFLHDGYVADGAAIAARAFSGEDKSLDISRVSPYRYGIKAFSNGEEIIANIVLKNTPLPICETRSFVTSDALFRKLKVEIYENPSTEKNVPADDVYKNGFNVDVELSVGPSVYTVIDVKLCVDEDGVLSVYSTEHLAGNELKETKVL